MDLGNACALYSSNIMEKCIYHSVTPAKSLETRLYLADRKNTCCFYVCIEFFFFYVSFKIATVQDYYFQSFVLLGTKTYFEGCSKCYILVTIRF